jgi:hypothetical protein
MPSEVAVQARLAYVSMYVRSVADSRRFYADLLPPPPQPTMQAP